MKVRNWPQQIPRGGCPLKQALKALKALQVLQMGMAQHHHRPPWTPEAQLHHPTHL